MKLLNRDNTYDISNLRHKIQKTDSNTYHIDARDARSGLAEFSTELYETHYMYVFVEVSFIANFI